ncbi:DNA polymerase kappa [Nosema granulosis]|uniref:DNA polymerase kappa n=1 Tax=Nosema granulosis TaxID=83296 RepID=A0A9P6KY76_9MICR|nr:DNA polymerase kappa [Nosema granulosis]
MKHSIDFDEIKKIGIASDSQDPFNENNDDRIVKIRDKANDLKIKSKNITKTDIDRATSLIEIYKKELAREWPALFGGVPEKIYVHIDLDSFYASVETLLHPEYKDIPLGVGSMLMLATCNYPARKYGIKAGMPGYMAKKLCPSLVITPCNFGSYNFYSDKVMAILTAYNKNIEIYGIDEACLVFDKFSLKEAYETYNNDAKVGKTLDEDLLVYESFGFESATTLVDKIREMVFRNTKLTVSAGISVCRGLSKFGCGVNKPNGMFIINQDFDSHILNLPVDKINGIGKATKEMLLRAFDIHTVLDLRNNLGMIYLLFPQKTFFNLFRLAHGLSVFDSKTTVFNAKDKSIGRSMSFKPTQEYKAINDILWGLSRRISNKLTQRRLCGSIVTLNYKFCNFKTFTKRKKIKELVETEIEIFNLCSSILRETFGGDENQYFEVPEALRLIGISVSGLVDQKNTNLLNKYKDVGSVYDCRECPVCSVEFIHESQMVFESHVNICLNKRMRREKEEKKKLDWYFQKKTK